MTPLPELVLVGGGHTHVQVLRSFAMEPPAAKVTLVVDRPIAIYSGMVPGLVAGQYRAAELEIDTVPLARRAGARVVLAAATGLDPAERRLQVAGRPPLRYDLISFDVGSTVAALDLPGVAEHTVPTRPIVGLVDRLEDQLERARAADGAFRVLVVGAGAGGVELAFTLRERLLSLGVDPEVSLVEASERLLAGFPQRVAKRVEEAATRVGIEIRLDTEVRAVEADRVLLAHGDALSTDLVVWVVGAAPHRFLREVDLPQDASGFLLIRPTLQVVDHNEVFAVGDCATLESTSTPKAGVYAVRQGPYLTANLRAALAGETLRRYVPQRDFLSLLNLGDGTAIGCKRGFVFAGRWVMGLKDWIDRRFMRRFQVLDETGEPQPGFEETMESEEPMLCGGCAAKLAQSPLERALARIAGSQAADSQVILGLEHPDDVAGYRTPAGDAVFTTVDAFRGFSDDPFLVGEIAAVNALSDLFAKALEPRFAQALITLADPRHRDGEGRPLEPVDEEAAEETLFQVLAGARQVFDREGVSLIGGHTTTGPELVVGFSVDAVSAGPQPLLKSGAEIGDALVLTKPLGTGVVLHADMQGLLRGQWLEEALASMRLSNRRAGELARRHSVHAATDVTGFGLAGHLAEVLRSAPLAAAIELSRLPALPGARELLARGLRSTSHRANARLRRGVAVCAELAADPRFPLLFDPQTSGGLLLSAPRVAADRLLAELVEAGYDRAEKIGEVISRGSEGAFLRIER